MFKAKSERLCKPRAVATDGSSGATNVPSGGMAMGGGCAWGAGGTWELSASSPQFPCDPETALTNKSLFKKRKGKGKEVEERNVGHSLGVAKRNGETGQ